MLLPRGHASVIENGETFLDFNVTNGATLGCFLAPLLFIYFFSMMLLVAFKGCKARIPICYHMDGNVVDFTAWTSVSLT